MEIQFNGESVSLPLVVLVAVYLWRTYGPRLVKSATGIRCQTPNWAWGALFVAATLMSALFN